MTAIPKAQAAPSVKIDIFRLGVVSFGHLVGDMYYATLIPLWPLLIDRMSLTLTDVGFFTSLTSFMLMPVQPFIGWLVDRFPRAWFMILGLIGAALGMSLIGLAPTYSLLMVCVVFGRFCNAMFHPHAAMMVRATSGGRHGTAMSIFTFAGNIGIAVGPLLSVGVVTLFGLESTYLLIPFGFVAAAAIYHFVGVDVPKESSVSDAAERSGTGLSVGAQTLVGPLILLAVLMTFRAAIMGGFTTFLPIFLVDNRAVSLLMGGFGLSALALFGALGGLLGGIFPTAIPVLGSSPSPYWFLGRRFLLLSGRTEYSVCCFSSRQACLCLQANRLPPYWPKVLRRTGWRWHQG